MLTVIHPEYYYIAITQTSSDQGSMIRTDERSKGMANLADVMNNKIVILRPHHFGWLLVLGLFTNFQMRVLLITTLLRLVGRFGLRKPV